MEPIRHRWAIVLAGGEGTRLRPLTRQCEGDDRPKQFCRLLGPETLLEHARRRIAPVIPADRTFIVVTRRHERFYTPLLRDAPPGCVVSQPVNRGTAPAILYGLLRVASSAPVDSVAIFPSDHYVSDDSAFMGHVAVAFEAVRVRPDLIVLLGVEPDGPEPGYGWIEPGDRVSAGCWRSLFRVRRVWEEPARPLAERLLAAGALWDTFVIVAWVPALLALIRHAVPGLLRAFEAGQPAINTVAEPEVFRALYARIPSIDFSQRVLAPGAANLAVLRVSGVAWSDLDDPERARAALTKVGIDREGARAPAAPA